MLLNSFSFLGLVLSFSLGIVLLVEGISSVKEYCVYSLHISIDSLSIRNSTLFVRDRTAMQENFQISEIRSRGEL